MLAFSTIYHPPPVTSRTTTTRQSMSKHSTRVRANQGSCEGRVRLALRHGALRTCCGSLRSGQSDVASRLKNSPGGRFKHTLLDDEERTWELLTKAEVEARLGYPVTELPRDKRVAQHRHGQGRAVDLHPGHDSVHHMVGRLPMRRFRNDRGTNRQGQYTGQERRQTHDHQKEGAARLSERNSPLECSG